MADTIAARSVADSLTLNAALLARSRRAWRIAFVAYIIPITIATHWPRLGFPGAGMIDKFVHFIGFGMLAWMAMHAAPWGRALVGFAFAAAWVYVDERTQALEILGRTFSGLDMIAGWLGVLMAGLIYGTSWLLKRYLRPEGFIIEALMYARGQNWLVAAAVALLTIIVVGLPMYGWDCEHGAIGGYPTAIYPIGFSALIGVVLATIVVQWRARKEFERSTGWVMPWQLGPRWALALRALVACQLYVLYLGLVVVLFPHEIEGEPSSDHAGFMVLRQGFLVACIVFALVANIAPQRASRGTLSP